MSNKIKKKKKEAEKDKNQLKNRKTGKAESGFDLNYSSSYPLYLENKQIDLDFD